MPPKDYLTIEEVWPLKVSSSSGEVLRKLDDEQFAVLRQLVRKRVIRRGGHRSYATSLVRELKLRRRVKKRVPYTRAALLANCQPCDILGTFVPDRAKRWKKIHKRKHGSSIALEHFSFIDNPIETFTSLHRVAVAECERYGFYIDFMDEFVLDIGPYLVFGVMRQRMAPVTSGGTLSGPTQKVLKAVGLHQFLKMKLVDSASLSDVYPLPVKYRRRAGSTKSTTPALEPTSFEKQADDTADNINVWLSKLDPKEELTDFGLSRIKGVVVELLNNAERHGRVGGDGEWVAAGFMAQRETMINGIMRTIHICHLGFYNPGRPISESILEAPTDILEQIERYKDAHRRSGFSPETLSTVFALQDGISRVLQGGDQPTGGTGLMDVVEFANSVGRTGLEDYKPKVAIVSGRSYVKFDDQYGEGIEVDGRRLQWFNDENNAMKPPSPEHVMDLPSTFPGTLITLRFVLDEAFERVNSDVE